VISVKLFLPPPAGPGFLGSEEKSGFREDGFRVPKLAKLALNYQLNMLPHSWLTQKYEKKP